jgi:hypothetical protein
MGLAATVLPPIAAAAAAVVRLASVVNAVINLQQARSQRVHLTAAAASPHATTAAPTSAPTIQHTPHTCALLRLLLLWLRLLLLCSRTATAVTVAAATAAAASAGIDHYCCLLLVALISARQAHFCARWARPEAATHDTYQQTEVAALHDKHQCTRFIPEIETGCFARVCHRLQRYNSG